MTTISNPLLRDKETKFKKQLIAGVDSFHFYLQNMRLHDPIPTDRLLAINNIYKVNQYVASKIIPALTHHQTQDPLLSFYLETLNRIATDYPQTGERVTGFLCQTTSQCRSIPKRYSLNDFSIPTLAKVLKSLALEGLLVHHKGFKGKWYATGLASLFVPTEAFRRLIESHDQGQLRVIWFKDDIEVIYLKDDDAELMDYTDNQIIRSIRETITNTNRLRINHQWTYIPIDKPATELMRQREPEIIVFSNEYKQIHSRDLICKRVFNGSFNHGGRFYANAQQLSKAERATIQIDNQPCIEIDIKSLHPRILYNLNKMEAPDDCYIVDGHLRDHAKQAMLIMLNAKSFETSVRALRDKTKRPSEECRDLIEKLLAIHRPIAKYFFNESWKLLQSEDSSLTERIMLKAVALNVPILPVHDSYITSTKHGLWLADTIKQCYYEKYGYRCVLSY